MVHTGMPGSHDRERVDVIDEWKDGDERSRVYQAMFLTTNIHRMESVFGARGDKVT